MMQQKLDAVAALNNSLLCIGLDTDRKKLPGHLVSSPDALFLFNKAIIDETHDLVCAYKPNAAFYEAEGEEGIKQLKKTCEYLSSSYPMIPIILDAKRGDIGNTNNGYVTFAFDYLGVDAITLHPYLGKDALQPFLDRKEKAAIILCRTSNPGSGEFQELAANGRPLYQTIAEAVSRNWNTNNNCMLVVGATYPKELSIVRSIVGEMTLLIPGIGAQGGDIEETVKAGMNTKKAGMMISSSRSILYASNDADFAKKAREEARHVRDEINVFRL